MASSPLGKARWYHVTEVAQLPLIRKKQIEAVKQYALVLFAAPKLIGLPMDFNVPKPGFWHLLEFMTQRGLFTAPRWTSHSPDRSLYMTTSQTHGKSWYGPLR